MAVNQLFIFFILHPLSILVAPIQAPEENLFLFFGGSCPKRRFASLTTSEEGKEGSTVPRCLRSYPAESLNRGGEFVVRCFPEHRIRGSGGIVRAEKVGGPGARPKRPRVGIDRIEPGAIHPETWGPMGGASALAPQGKSPPVVRSTVLLVRVNQERFSVIDCHD